MKKLKDPKPKIFPSSTRGGKKLPSSSTLDSPSVMSKLATPPHAMNSNMSQVIDDATSTMNDAYYDASTLLDNDDVPLGEFLDEQIARVIQHDVVEFDDELETKTTKTPASTSLPRYELPKVLEGYVSTLIKSRVGDDGVPAILQYRSSDLYLMDRKEIITMCPHSSPHLQIRPSFIHPFLPQDKLIIQMNLHVSCNARASC